ncbi:unnamed protein product [Sphagnum jensenii]|uniref:Uncharacterized protein n=1 Tax=Sphagnum jensenii TaxID=128206 RepID=A0ABP1B1M3_9BRYO
MRKTRKSVQRWTSGGRVQRHRELPRRSCVSQSATREELLVLPLQEHNTTPSHRDLQYGVYDCWQKKFEKRSVHPIPRILVPGRP